MNEGSQEKRVREISGRVRRLIDHEVEEGMARFNCDVWESRLTARLEAETSTVPYSSGPKPSWLPAVGFAGAAVAAVFVLLWFAGPRPKAPGSSEGTFGLALAGAPGVRSLELTADVREAAARSALAGTAAVLSEALSAAARTASGPPMPAWPAAERLTPRYGLKEKMELLFGERAIVRALMNYKDKFGEV